MTKGSCMCGDFTYEYTGDAVANAICHCTFCKKSAGLNGSTNTIIPDANFKKLTGTIKTWQRTGMSGKDVTYGYCANCPTIVWVKAEAMGDLTIVKPGTIDNNDVADELKPGAEIFTKNRVKWVKATEGAEQKEVS